MKLFKVFKIKNLSVYQLTLFLLVSSSLISIVFVATSWAFMESHRVQKEIKGLKEIALVKQKERLKNEVMRQIYYLEYVKSDTIHHTIEQLKDDALSYFENIRFGNDGYFFVNTYGGSALLFDGQKLKEPINISDLTDPNGFRIFDKELELAKLEEGGFFQYLFKKIYSTKPVPKLSYVNSFDHWGWVIGAGDYLDSVDNEIAFLEKQLKNNLYRAILIAIGIFIPVLIILIYTSAFIAKFVQNQFNKFVRIIKQTDLSKKNTGSFDSIFISELKEIASDIAKAESRVKQFGNIIEQSQNEIYIFNQDDLHFVLANRGARENCGYLKEELVKMTPLDLIPMLNKAQLLEFLEPLQQANKQIHFETVHQRKDKSLYPVDVHIALSIFNEKPVYIAFIYDISIRKAAEKELHLSNERFSHLFNNAPISLWEEDYSELRAYLDVQLKYYKLPIEELFQKYPEVLIKCSGLTKVIDVNNNTLELYEAESKEELLGSLDKIFTADSLNVFKQSIISLYQGKEYFSSEGKNKTLKGKDLNLFLRWAFLTVPNSEIKKVIVSAIDLTELRQTELELKATEARFRALFENNHTVMFLINPENGKIIDTNPAAVKFYGYSYAQFIKELSVFDLNTLSKEETIARMSEANLLEQTSFIFQHRLSNGEIRDVEVYSGTLTYDKKPVLFSIVHDNTDKKQAEEMLIQSRNKMESIFRAVSTGIGVVSERVFTEINDRFIEMTGYSSKELIGKESSLIYPSKEEFERVGKEKYKQIKEKGTGTIETQFIRKDGRSIDVLLSSTPIDPSDLLKGVTFTALDITERKNMEKSLKHSHDLMRYIIEHNQNDVAVHDRNLNYIYVSQSYLEHYNINEKEIIGKHHYEVLPNIPQKWRDVHQRALAGEILGADEDAYEREDGLIDWTRWQCRPWYESDGSVGGIIVYTEIITKQKQTEEELRKYQLHLEETVKARTDALTDSQNALLNLVDDLNLQSEKLGTANNRLAEINDELETFTYSVSHDLKAPLRGIDGYSQLLLESASDILDGDSKTFLANIRSSTQQMNVLIEDLLAYSRLERRGYVLEPVIFASIVKTILLQYQAEIEGDKIKIALTFPEDLIIDADKESLMMVMRNLIDNAIKFSAKSDNPKIEVGSMQSNTESIIFVKDNGIGFDMKYHDRIYKIFQRLHLAEEYQGTGIGLAMVSKAVQRMHGQIWAESEVGKGASFYMKIGK